ncbi:hypothetical protein HC776_02595, partial [bacterium]|nr:hypothetical protein [bacterium]
MAEGITLGDKLAELLDAKVGDLVTVEVMEGERPICDVPVTATITEYGGTNAYMDVEALHRLMRKDRLDFLVTLSRLWGFATRAHPIKTPQLLIHGDGQIRISREHFRQGI